MKAKTLKNGMRVHLVPMKGTDAVTALVLVKVGSRYETDKVWGGSHFIEHMMFKGTKKRPSALDISKLLDRYGAYYNAYTGKDVTGYYVKIASDKAPVAIDLLHDMLFNSKYEAAEMKREKNVIIEEIKMYEENPIMHVGNLLDQVMFEGNRLGLDIAGTKESMLAMKRKDVIAYRDQYYIPSQMVVVLAGDVPKNAMELLEKSFGRVKNGEEPPSFFRFGEMPSRKGPRIARQYKDVTQIQVAMGFPGPGKQSKDVPAMQLLAGILGGGMSSRLFSEVRERRGLCYTVRASADTYEDVGEFVIRAGLDAGRLTEAMKVIVNELKKIKRHGVTAQELAYMKDNLSGSMQLSLENSSHQAEFYGRQELYMGKTESPEERLARYKRVRRSDIKRVAEDIIDFSRLSLAAIGPYKTDAALKKHLPKDLTERA
jgi:predicted Zn-dependent peptidase